MGTACIGELVFVRIFCNFILSFIFRYLELPFSNGAKINKNGISIRSQTPEGSGVFHAPGFLALLN